jgi:hypothetical protein
MWCNKLPLAFVTDELDPVLCRGYRNNDENDECQCSDRNDVQETTNAFRLGRVDFVDVIVNFYSTSCSMTGNRERRSGHE